MHTNHSCDRRDVLRGIVAGAGIAALPPSLRREALHEQVVAAALKAKANRDVRLRLIYPDGCLPNLQQAIDAWAKSTGIAIDATATRVDEVASHLLLTEMAGAQTWDVALPATFTVPDLIDGNCLQDLSAAAKRLEPPALRAGMLFDVGDYYQNRLYGYQTDGDCYLLFYNRQLLEDQALGDRFEELHGRRPSIARTWRELDEMMAFFATKQNGGHSSTLFRTIGYAAWEWWLRFTSKGRLVLDDDLNPTFDGPEGVAALQELITATRSQYERSRSNGLFENWTAFATGKHFCNLGWGGTQKALRREGSLVRDDLLVAPPPGSDASDGPESISYFNWGWNYVVAKRSKEAELAYLFCLFAVCPEPSLKTVRKDGFFDPFRKEHYGDPGIREAYGAQFLDVHQSSLSAATPDLYLPGQAEYLDALRKQVHAAISGRVTAEEGMRTAAQAWRRTTERRGQAGQLAQWTSLKKRYPQDLRKWLR